MVQKTIGKLAGNLQEIPRGIVGTLLEMWEEKMHRGKGRDRLRFVQGFFWGAAQ